MHGWLAFLSAVFVAIGALLLLGAFYGVAYQGLNIQMTIGVAVVLLMIAAIVSSMSYAGYKAQYTRVKTGMEALIGEKGIVVTDLKPKGEIRVSGEFWQAITKDAPIKQGKTVKVVGMEGMFLVVESTKEKA